MLHPLKWVRLCFACPDRRADWARDPLSHPAIAGMSERERADLPFDPRAVASD